MKFKFKIIHCHDFISMHNANLAKAERELNINSQFISLKLHPFKFKADKVLTRSNHFLIIELARWKLFFYLLFRTKTIHFIGGTSIMPKKYSMKDLEKKLPLGLRTIYFCYSSTFEMMDLFIFKLLKKKIIFTFLGSDARLKSHAQNIHVQQKVELYCRNQHQVKHRIEIIDRYADSIFYVNPDLCEFLPQRSTFIPYAVDFNLIKISNLNLSNKPVIIHAPSKKSIKGTEFVIHAIKKLQQTELNFEFILLENLSNNKVLEVMNTADLLIDQLLIGWYGFVSVEFMAKGKDVMCYLDLPKTGSTPEKAHTILSECPIINVSIDNLEQKLRKYIELFPSINKQKRRNANIAFSKKWHNSIRIAHYINQQY